MIVTRGNSKTYGFNTALLICVFLANFHFLSKRSFAEAQEEGLLNLIESMEQGDPTSLKVIASDLVQNFKDPKSVIDFLLVTPISGYPVYYWSVVDGSTVTVVASASLLAIQIFTSRAFGRSIGRDMFRRINELSEKVDPDSPLQERVQSLRKRYPQYSGFTYGTRRTCTQVLADLILPQTIGGWLAATAGAAAIFYPWTK